MAACAKVSLCPIPNERIHGADGQFWPIPAVLIVRMFVSRVTAWLLCPSARRFLSFGDMIAQLRQLVRQWWLTRNILLVNFGSDPGRVPLVMLSRGEVADVTRQDTQISFSSRSLCRLDWRF